MSEWPIVLFGDAPLEILDGDRGSEYPKKADFSPLGDWLFLDTSNVRREGFDFSSLQFITDEKERKLRKGRLSRNDVVLTTRGTIGNIGFFHSRVPFEKMRINSGMVILRAAQEHLYPEFLFHLVRSDLFREQVRALTSGSAQPQLPIRDMRMIKIPVPPMDIQNGIADILSAYDDLIEVNQRRIAILEEMARRLFDEWFVHFRYPGHEAGQLVESTIGQIPRGWRAVRADQIIEFDPRTKVEKEGEKTFVPMSALDTSVSVISGREVRSGNSGSKFRNGDTLMARITPCLENGKTGLVNFLAEGETAFGSTEFTVMRGLRVPVAFVYLLARSESFRAAAIKSMGGSDGRQRVKPAALEGFMIPLPPSELLATFGTITDPLFAQVRVSADQSTRLRAARDLLLPKLISGEIEVGRAEAVFAEAAE